MGSRMAVPRAAARRSDARRRTAYSTRLSIRNDCACSLVTVADDTFCAHCRVKEPAVPEVTSTPIVWTGFHGSAVDTMPSDADVLRVMPVVTTLLFVVAATS